MDIDNVLLYICLLFAILILFSILFGCRYRKIRERFEDSPPKKEDKEDNWLMKIANGDMNGADITKLIQEGTITRENLSNMIQKCESFYSKKKTD